MTMKIWLRRWLNLYPSRRGAAVRQAWQENCRPLVEPLEYRMMLALFGTPVSYALGSSPTSVVVGDFNGDGKLDAAAAINNGKVSILLGNGNGTFQPAINTTVGSAPTSLVVGDFNGDSKLDLAVTYSGSNTVSILLGNGNGNFQPAVNTAVGSVLAVGDFNNDGKPDLAVIDSTDYVSILLGNGNGTFQPAVNTAVGSGLNSLAVGDFNGDGKPDLAVGLGTAAAGGPNGPGGPGSVSILLGNGDGSFAAAGNYLVANQPWSVVVGDFNGDGHPDLAVGNADPGDPNSQQNPSVSILLGNGNGTFGTAVNYIYPKGAYTFNLALADFNGDGHLDLAALDGSHTNVSVQLGNGDGTFGAAINFSVTEFSLTSVAVGNFNGAPDILAATSLLPNGVSILLNTSLYVTSSSANLAANASNLTINGFGFSPTAANNTVSFSGGVTGTVTSASSTQLTVTSLSGLVVGNLNASVSVSGVSSGTAVQVATVIPVVTSSTANLAANASSLTINGVGFSTTASNNTVSFSGGASGTVTSASSTQLTVTSLSGLLVGNLTASVTVSGVSSGTAVQVGTVIPVVTSSTANLAANASSLTINGFGFDSTASNNAVSFSGGVTGTVTSASSTQLTVTSLSGLVLGNLTASVTVNGISSGTAVQVATVVPVITSSTANLAANASSLTINGFGFSTTAANDTVSFSGGASGTVTSASSTQLTVTSLSGLVGGNLNASVSVNGVSSGTAVQVATVIPVVTSSTANLAANASSLTINGFGFSTTAGNDTVTFSGGVTGTVTSASNTQLTVTSVSGLVLGNLNASVSVNGISSGTAVQVGTVIPVVTSSTANLAANASSLTINGFGFSTTASNDSVSLSGGASGTVTAASSTQLTVTSLSGLVLGNLTVSVSVYGTSSGTAVQVATVIPVVTSNTANLPVTASSLTINGFGFDSTASNNTVSFSGGASGTVTSASSTQLTVTSLSGLLVGNLTASVTVSGVSSGTAVQVGTVIPVVTSSTANLAANASSLTINGVGFSTTASNNTVSFSGGASGTVTSASSTQLTVTGLNGLVVGNLTASVTVSGVSSGTAVQVGTVIPVVTSSTANLAANASSLTINGFGFSTTASNDSVSLSGGASGTVTSASSTQLTVTSLSGLVLGNLTASVSVNGTSSGTAVQVATVIPVVTSNTANLPVTASSLTINGFGFDSTASNDSVSFSGGASGTVTSASSTQLTVTSLNGLVGGNLTASVTVDGVSSGTAVQVATVIPVVTSSTANLAANASSLTINGFGFSTTAGNDTVTFSGGVTGTVTSASNTQLTVTSVSGLVLGNLNASVSVNGISSGTAVQVGTVIPVVTSSTANLAANASSLTINGFGFSTTASNDSVSLSGGASGTVTSASSTQLTVTSLSGLVLGNLTASVTVSGVSSGTAVQVATVIPVVTSNTANLPVTASSLTINGFGFDSTASNDSVSFSGGASGTVTSASSTQLTVTGLSGLLLGNLTASVTVNGVSSGAAVEVATVVPAENPALAYVSYTFAGDSFNQSIADADFGTAGNQPAAYGVTAFTTIGAALSAITFSGQVIVNAGTYGEAVSVTGTQTLTITGSAAVTVNSLASVAGSTVQINGSSLTDGNATSTTVAGVLTGGGALVKLGSSTLTLSGSDTYTGTTTISGGTLTISGSLSTATSAATLSGTGVTLNGTGTVNRPVGVSSTGDTIGAGIIGTPAISSQNGLNGLTIIAASGTGITVTSTGSVAILGNTIQTGSGYNNTAIDVNGGKALLQDNNLDAMNVQQGSFTPSSLPATSSPYYGIYAVNGAQIDAGQFAGGAVASNDGANGGTNGYTGLGISAGANKLIGYQNYTGATLPSSLSKAVAQAIVNDNTNAPNNKSGPQGLPNDLYAQNNDFLGYGFGSTYSGGNNSDYATIEPLVYHDSDTSGVGFVNYTTPAWTTPQLLTTMFYSVNVEELGDQLLTFSGVIGSLSGYFTLTLNGQATGHISTSNSATTLASNIQSALALLPNIGSGNVLVSGLAGTAGSSTPTGVFTITFTGALAQVAEPTMTYTSGLTSGNISSLVSFANQKSMIRRIAFVFSNYVTVASGAISLTMQGSKAATASTWNSGGTIAMTATQQTFDPTSGQFRYEYAFVAQTGVESTGSLTDGDYQLSYNLANITGTSGAEATLPSANYQNPNSAGSHSKYTVSGSTATLNFHRLFGDLDGVGLIDTDDIAAMAIALGHLSGTGGYDADLDSNNDGSVDTTTDNPQFTTRKNDYSTTSFALGWDI